MARRRIPNDELIALATVTDRLFDRAGDFFPAPIVKAVAEARENDVLLFAGSLAFYALVSLAPLTIVVLWVTSLFLGDAEIERVAIRFAEAAPQGLAADDALKGVARLGTDIGVPALLAGLWPATAYGAGVRRGFARLSGEKKEHKGLRGRALLLVVLLPMFVVGALVGSYYGTTIVEWNGVGKVMGVIGALLLGFAAGSVSIAMMFRIFTSRPLSWSAVQKATLLTAAAISVVSLLFTLYLTIANFEQHYATSGVAGIVLLGVWLYISNALLLIGYQLAVRYDKEK